LYSGHTCLVEWPEKALSIFPENTFKVTITMIDTDTRKVSINL
jgi:tRNA threonylcarbamoyladenosine biosynthesis protein TsaE